MTSHGPVKQGPRLRSRVAMTLPPLRPGSHDGRRGQVTSVCAAGEKEILLLFPDSFLSAAPSRTPLSRCVFRC
ncbi:hypothetical protein NDU88_006248 [Pleurodeles waltl]|uniref:Uncharacterized protein n=1 Tax=Pleurodeles waltl TaxID=8319 RepID=A0AAV7UP28_PLEWA|nr:hypothetical protein NDU88_006248 [Pleurodeles waltl]